MQAIGSVMTYGMNLILISFTPTATAVFGVYFKLQSFIFMPVFGLNNGLVPILAYNYGAGRRDRFTDALKCGILYAVSIMAVGASHYLSELSACRLWYCLRNGVPGARQRCLQYACLHRQTAGRALAGSLSPVPDRRGYLRLVGLSDR